MCPMWLIWKAAIKIMAARNGQVKCQVVTSGHHLNVNRRGIEYSCHIEGIIIKPSIIGFNNNMVVYTYFDM